MAEESLLKDILMPSERIRPGYETTEIETRGGAAVVGLLKSEGATSVTLAQAGGVEQVILRKDIAGVRRLATSLMPSFAETLAPQDAADLLGWLRSNLGTSAPYMELRVYSVTSGKMAAVLERFRDTVDPVRRRHAIDTLGYWTAPGKTNGGVFVYLMIAPSKEELQKREKEFGADTRFKAGYAASQKKYGNTVDRIEAFSLSVDGASKLNFTPAAKSRTFELRIYSIEPGRLEAFRNRWRDSAIPIYERKGLQSIGWWVSAEHDAEGHEQFICLLAGDSAESLQRAISEFHADPDWEKIEKETERDGKLRSSVRAYRLVPSDFSALK
jgi:putative heme-binding domain-containing protein